MIRVIFILVAAWSMALSKQIEPLPEVVLKAYQEGTISESGGFWVEDIDRNVLDAYVRSHWRLILNDYESFGKEVNDSLVDSGKQPFSKDSILATMAAMCDALPPGDYIDFLNVWMDLYEERKISPWAFEGVWSTWNDRKRYFLAVNWEHPDVRKLLERGILLAGREPSHRATVELLEDTAQGKLDDSYQANLPETTPFPETLPGIKLKRPSNMSASNRRWKDYEKEWAVRHGEERLRQPSSRGIESKENRRFGFPWQWLVAGIFILMLIVAIFWNKNRSNQSIGR